MARHEFRICVPTLYTFFYYMSNRHIHTHSLLYRVFHRDLIYFGTIHNRVGTFLENSVPAPPRPRRGLEILSPPLPGGHFTVPALPRPRLTSKFCPRPVPELRGSSKYVPAPSLSFGDLQNISPPRPRFPRTN